MSDLTSAEYDPNLVKSFILPFLNNERHIEPTVIKKTNKVIAPKSGDFQLWDVMNFLGGATSLDSIFKTFKILEAKGFITYEWFDHPDKMPYKQSPRITLATVNLSAITLWKPNTWSMLT